MRAAQKLRRNLRFYLAVFGCTALVLVTSSCSKNAFLESAKRDTDAALLFEARKQMDGKDWTGALASLQKMSVTGQAERSVKVAFASAYAGRCGLNLIRMAEQLSGAGSSGILLLFLNALSSATASSIADCQAAEAALLSISTTAASRTVDENLMLSFIGFSKVGAILATYADTDDNNVADVGFDACDTGDIPEAMVREFGTGLTLAVQGLNASGSSVGAALATSVTAACTALAGIDPAYDFCVVTDPALFSADQVKALSGIIHSQDAPGLGTCTNPLAACVCP